MKVLTLLTLFVLFLFMVAPLLAQDVQPADQPPDDSTTSEPPALGILAGMAAAVAYVIEMAKNGILKQFREDWNINDSTYAFVVQVLAFVAALILIFGADASLNIFTVAGLYPNADPTFARIVTALVISFGSAALHVAYDFLRSPVRAVPGLAAYELVAPEPGTTTRRS